MSNEALKDIQKALNVIRSIADKEQLEGKVKALELMTQALQSHITGIKAASAVSVGMNKTKALKLRKPTPPSMPKSFNLPGSAVNPNAVIPTQPSNLSDVATTADNQNSRFQRENARF